MQYAKLKQAVEIDNRIARLDKELRSLYAKRASLVGASGLSRLAGNSKNNTVQLLRIYTHSSAFPHTRFVPTPNRSPYWSNRRRFPKTTATS